MTARLEHRVAKLEAQVGTREARELAAFQSLCENLDLPVPATVPEGFTMRGLFESLQGTALRPAAACCSEWEETPEEP